MEQLLNLSIEQKIVGKLLSQNTGTEEMADIFTQLSEEDLNPNTAARELFKVMKTLHDSGTAVSYENVLDKVIDRQDLCLEISNIIRADILYSQTPVHVLIDRMLEQSNHRKQGQYIKLLEEQWNAGQNCSELLEMMVNSQYVGNKFQIKTMADLMNEVQADLLDSQGQQIPTGFPKLDEQLNGGLRKGWFYIIGARSGHGKTAFASTIFRNIVKAGKVPYYITLEMKAVDIATRMFCGESGLSEKAVVRDIERFTDTHAALQNWSNALFDDRSRTISDIEQNSRYAVKRMGADVIFIDYIGLVQGQAKRSKIEEIADYSRRLQTLSKELDRPIVCLSQINRVSDSRRPVVLPRTDYEFKVPMMIDLADSSALEKDADCIIMLSIAEDMDTGERPLLRNGQNPAVIRIEKNRKGEKGRYIKLAFNGGTTTFAESEW